MYSQTKSQQMNKKLVAIIGAKLSKGLHTGPDKYGY